jgi:hypothetical protein
VRKFEVSSCRTGSLCTDVIRFRVNIEEKVFNINNQLPLGDGFICREGHGNALQAILQYGEKHYTNCCQFDS